MRWSSSSSGSLRTPCPPHFPPQVQPPAPQRASIRSEAPVTALPALRWSASTEEGWAPGPSAAAAGIRAVCGPDVRAARPRSVRATSMAPSLSEPAREGKVRTGSPNGP